MITLGIDLSDREARLVGVRKGENGQDAVRPKRPAIAHAGLVTFAANLTAMESDGTGRPSSASNPFAKPLKDQLTRWGVKPSSIVFTGPDIFFEDEYLRAWLFECGRALNPDRDPILTTTRQAILTALAYQPVPLIAILLQPLRRLDLPEDGQPAPKKGARDYTTNVVGLTETGQSHFAPPLNPPVEDLAAEIWTPDTPGPALQQWVGDVAQRVDTLRGKIGKGDAVPVHVVGNPVTFPHLIPLLSARMPKLSIQWAQPWELFSTQDVHRPFLNTMGNALMPALGAALTTHQPMPQEAAPAASGAEVAPRTPYSAPAFDTSPDISEAPRPSAFWGVVALATLLAWIPVMGELGRREQVAQRRVAAARANMEESKTQIARLEELQAFVNRLQPQPAGTPLTDVLRAALANVPASIYITGCHLEARADGPRLTLQGLTRKPDEVKKWAAAIARATKAQSTKPTFNQIKPRYQFSVSFSGFPSAVGSQPSTPPTVIP